MSLVSQNIFARLPAQEANHIWRRASGRSAASCACAG